VTRPGRRFAAAVVTCPGRRFAAAVVTRAGRRFAATVAALLALWPGRSLAYEDQIGLGVQLGYAHATDSRLPHSGALLGLEVSLGLDDIWSVRGFATYSLHPGTPTLSVAMLGAELLYLVDILEFVPYFGAGLDAIGSWVSGSDGFSAEFGVHPVVGLDWLVTRGWTLGLEARPVFLVTAWSRQPIYITLGVNAALLFDL
jgi:hypothetical protein